MTEGRHCPVGPVASARARRGIETASPEGFASGINLRIFQKNGPIINNLLDFASHNVVFIWNIILVGPSLDRSISTCDGA